MKIALKSLTLSLAATLAAGLAQAAPAPVSLRVVTPFANGHLLADTAQQFKRELALSAPHIQVSVQAGVLNEQSINPAFQKCAPGERVGELLLTGGQPIQDYAPEWFFFNGPYVIRDFDHLQRVWNSRIGDSLRYQLETKGGMVSFAPVYRGFRQFTSNQPINSPADFQGVKLRLPPVPDWISVWQPLGVAPVQVPLPGIYDALKTGSAQASEGDLTQIKSLKLNEVQKQLVITNHLVGFGMPLANACFFRNELSTADQEKVRNAMHKAALWGSRKIQQDEARLLAELQTGGMQIVTPDAAAIRKAAEPAIRQLFATRWTVTDWQKVLAQ